MMNFLVLRKLPDNIGFEYKILGYINDKTTLNATYCAADIFVASSIEDAWPKTFAEAMYCCKSCCLF